MTDLEIILLAISAILGALAAAGIDLTSSSSNTPIDLKKAVYTILTAVIGAVIIVFVNMQIVEEITGWTYLAAFIMGAGAAGFSKAGTAIQSYRARRKG